MALVAGQQVGAYQIIGQFGQGGMATVYKAYHAKLDRHVAIKVMHPSFLNDPNFQSRFEREAQIIARLEHPNIVPVYDYSEFEGQPFLVMKFIEGKSLKGLISEGALSVDEIMQIMTPIADALTYAHQRGVLHRDIKPSNIVLDENNTPYLTDFGLARIAQAGESTMSADMILGTPQYISPEQARGDKYLDPRTDVYSLGIVLYELVVGRVPFNADTPYATVHDHIYTPLPMPSAVNADIPPAVEAVLVKALAKNPADRYSTANEMMDAFRQAINVSGLRRLNPNRIAAAEASLDQMRAADNLPTITDPIPPQPVVEFPQRAGPPAPPRPPAPPPASGKVEIDLGEVNWKEVGGQIRSVVSRGVKEGANIIEVIAQEVQEASRSREANMTDEERIRRKIEKREEERQGYIIHLLIYIFINVMLWGIYLGSQNIDPGLLANLLEGGQIPFEALSFPWPVFVTFFWGIGMLAHTMEYNSKYGRGAARRERRIQQEVERERRRQLEGEGMYLEEKPKRDRQMRLTADGELEEVSEDELSGVRKRKRR